MFNLLKDFLGYFKYHLFEVKVQPELSFKYKLWVIKRFFHVVFFGRKKSITYLFPNDIIITNKFGTFFVPKNSDMILTLSSKSESDLIDFFYLKNDSIFFDIGGNAGKYSTYIAKKYKPKKIYTFEPSPSTYSILQKNISLNPTSLISLHNVGVSDSDSKIRFANGNHTSGLSHIIDNNSLILDGFTIIEVDLISLDKFIVEQNINPLDVDFVKIDVEGHEMNVLNGATELLKSMRKEARILIEIFPHPTKVNDILKLIESHNFEVMKINFEYFLFTKK